MSSEILQPPETRSQQWATCDTGLLESVSSDMLKRANSTFLWVCYAVRKKIRMARSHEHVWQEEGMLAFTLSRWVLIGEQIWEQIKALWQRCGLDLVLNRTCNTSDLRLQSELNLWLYLTPEVWTRVTHVINLVTLDPTGLNHKSHGTRLRLVSLDLGRETWVKKMWRKTSAWSHPCHMDSRKVMAPITSRTI